MELKVWVDGIQRIVCGVTELSTCQDVVFALAHATGQTGRFTLIERWRNNERPLAPTENPLKILLKWGEYSCDVQFILQRSNSVIVSQQQSESQQQTTLQRDHQFRQNVLPSSNNCSISLSASLETPTAELYKKMNDTATQLLEIVSGNVENDWGALQQDEKEAVYKVSNENGPYYESTYDFPVSDLKNSLDQKSPQQNLTLDTLHGTIRNNGTASPSISSYGSLVPPPYRAPPNPSHGLTTNKTDCSRMDSYENNHTVQYKELIKLIQSQREKLHKQKSDLDKYDAEIVYLETKSRNEIEKLEIVLQEIDRNDQFYRQSCEQLQTLQYVEEENELVTQQEKTLKSEISLLRSKLVNCETELLQYKNKIRMLLDEIHLEQSQFYGSHQMERHLLSEVERIQNEIDLAAQNSEHSIKAADSLKQDICMIESAISDKKKRLEALIHEMKEVNLQGLVVTSGEETKAFIEVASKPCSNRRIIGSPRQLETAVPTNKNPHGVWV